MSDSSHQQQPILFTTDDYVMPQWAAMPRYTFFFQVIKEGSIVGKIQIKRKQFSLIGRLQDLCDIFIDNPTVSRKHAILQFQSGDPLPLLFDLGGAQGTFVNKQQLPPKAYKKLQLFANIKFGVSSRYYILRCPELQQKQNEEEQQKQNDFLKTLSQQNKMLSKQQARKRYLQLLQNDPYFGGQLKSRKFQGQQQQKMQSQQSNQYEGITWGIGDETQVYAFKNQRQFPIEPDVLRRLPGLDQTMLQRIAQYEDKFRIYDEIESELNELANRQKREYGLEKKLQNKKEKMEKRFVESLQALQKCEDWIRSNIFGDENSIGQNNHKNKKKQKEIDTFSEDEFYDRTLEDKQKNKAQTPTNNGNKQKPSSTNEQATVEDLWMLKNSFIHELTRKKQLASHQQQAKDFSLQNDQSHNSRTTQIPHHQNEQNDEEEEEDELEMFMKENNQNLQQQNITIHSRQIQILQQKLFQLRSKLSRFLSQKEIHKMEQEILHPEKIKQKESKKVLKEQQQKEKLSKTLERLQNQNKIKKEKQLKRQLLQKQCQDEYSQKIFDLYKDDSQQQQLKDDEQDYYTENNRYNRANQNYQPQLYQKENQYRRPNKKIHTNEDSSNYGAPNRNNFQQRDDSGESSSSQLEQIVDLTKTFQ